MTKPNTNVLLRLVFLGALWLAGLWFALYKTGPLSSEKIVFIILTFSFTAGFGVALWHIRNKLSPNNKFFVWLQAALFIPVVVLQGMRFMEEPTALRLVITICLSAILLGLIYEAYKKGKINNKDEMKK